MNVFFAEMAAATEVMREPHVGIKGAAHRKFVEACDEVIQLCAEANYLLILAQTESEAFNDMAANIVQSRYIGLVSKAHQRMVDSYNAKTLDTTWWKVVVKANPEATNKLLLDKLAEVGTVVDEADISKELKSWKNK